MSDVQSVQSALTYMTKNFCRDLGMHPFGPLPSRVLNAARGYIETCSHCQSAGLLKMETEHSMYQSNHDPLVDLAYNRTWVTIRWHDGFTVHLRFEDDVCQQIVLDAPTRFGDAHVTFHCAEGSKPPVVHIRPSRDSSAPKLPLLL